MKPIRFYWCDLKASLWHYLFARRYAVRSVVGSGIINLRVMLIVLSLIIVVDVNNSHMIKR